MAEEQIYEQVEQSGDPDPLGLRKKAAAQRQKSDPLGLRSKAATLKPQESNESFKPMTDWLTIPSGGYKPMEETNAIPIDDHTKRVGQAADRVSKELEQIDPHIGNLIYNYKKDIEGRVKSQALGINPKEQGPLNQQASLLESQMRPQTEVSQEEIEEYKAGMVNNVGMLRTALDQAAKDLIKTDPVRARQIKSDVYQLDAQDRTEKADKIVKNIEKIKSGDYDYDTKREVLVKPQGFFGSLATGFKQKNQLFKDYELYTKTDNESAIIKDLNEKIKEQDPDDAIIMPDGAAGEAGAILGGTPIKPIVGGIAAGWATTPLGGAAAAAGISAHEMYKLGYAAALPQNYAAIKTEHPEMPDYEAYQQAKALSENQAYADAAIGAASSFIGIKGGLTPGTSLLQKSVSSSLRQLGKAGVEKGLEGLAGGIAGGTGQVVKNIMAQQAGLDVATDAGVADQLMVNMLGTMGMAIFAKSANLLKPSTYNKLLHSISKLPEETITKEINNLQEVGYITPDEAQNVQTAIVQQKKIDATIKPNVPEADRIKVQELIRERDGLEASLETEDKAYHIDTKENIKALNERINNISKGNERGELQKLVDKAVKDDKVSGPAKDAFSVATEKELQGYMKDIAEQAADPATTEAAIAAFGEEIINKAKELYPEIKAPEPIIIDDKSVGDESQKPSISIIQPGEIKQPETITISPREQPKDVVSTEKVSVIMPKTQEDAVPIRSTKATIVDETSGSSQEVGEGVPESGQPPVPQEGQPTQEENIPPGQEGQVGEPEMIGITHAQMDEVSRELGLPEYSQDPETFEGWTREAKDRLAKDPEAVNKLINKLRRGESPDPVETQIMKMHFAALKQRYNNNPTPELLAEINRTKNLYNISGRQAGKELVARRGLMPVEDTLADFHMTDVEYNRGAPLTEKQTAQSTKEYNEIKAAKDALDQKVAQLEAENAKNKAEKKVAAEAKGAKKGSRKDYKAERKQILKDIGEKWKKSSKENLGVSLVPYAKELATIAPDVIKLVRNVIEEGITELPEIIKSVHGQLQEFIPEITAKDVHDIIAGEYTHKKPTKNKINQQLYEAKMEAKLINQLEQIIKGEEPKAERKKIQRNQKIESLKNQIRDLESEKTKATATEKRVKALEEELQRLKDRKEKEPTEKKQNDLTAREIDLKKQIDEERKKWAEEKKLSPELRALNSLKGRYKSKIKELEDQLAMGDYGPDEKPEPIKLDKEAQELKDRYIKLKSDRQLRLAEQEYANRTIGQKAKDKLTEVLNVPRTVMASVDLSAPLRQGLILTTSHPITGSKAFVESVRQAISPARFDRWLHDLKESPFYKDVLEKSGLYVADPNNLHLSAKEEAFMTNLAEKIPVLGRLIKGSERAYVSYLNKLRVDLFKMYAEKLVDRKNPLTPENSPEVYKGLADFINNATGRGDLGKLEAAAQVLNTAFFSPRLIASRINMLNPVWYWMLPAPVRRMALIDIAKMIGLVGTTVGLASFIPGVEVEKDPRSTDFGKIKVGNTRYDTWGGFQQYVRLISQLIAGGEKKGSTVVPLGNERGQHTRAEKVFSFFRGKLAPVPSMAVDALEGKTAVGEEVTLTGEAKDHLVPMIINDVREAWKEQDAMSMVYTGIPSLVGIGTTTYEKKAPKSGSSGKITKPTKNRKLSKTKK